jgi:hypothetical protein
MTAREKRFKPGSSDRRMDPTKRPKPQTKLKKPKNAPTPSFSSFNKNSKGIRPKLTKSQTLPEVYIGGKKVRRDQTPGPQKVRRDKIKKRLRRMALGGEAGESVGRATVRKSQIDARRKLLDDSINRVYKKVSEAKQIGKIRPKKKPKPPLKKKIRDKIKPKKKPKKP